MKKRGVRIGLSTALVVVVLAAVVAVAADAGSQGDPLVTLSYLRDVFTKQVMDQTEVKLRERDLRLTTELEQKIAQAEQELQAHGGGSSSGTVGGAVMTFVPVDLSAGQTLWGSTGCEVMLRSGKAVCAANKGTPGLVDTTDGSSLGEGGSLKADHLYMMTTDRGVTAKGNVTLLVRGGYTIK